MKKILKRYETTTKEVVVQKRDFYHFRFRFIPLLPLPYTSLVLALYLFCSCFIPLSSSWASARFGAATDVAPPYVDYAGQATMLKLSLFQDVYYDDDYPALYLVSLALSGTVLPTDILRVILYRDNNNDLAWDPGDTSLRATTFNSAGLASLGNTNGSESLDSIRVGTYKKYLIVVTMAGNPASGGRNMRISSFGTTLDWVQSSQGRAGTAERAGTNVATGVSSLVTIQANPAVVSATKKSPVTQIVQGVTANVLQMTLKTDQGWATVTAFPLSFQADPPDVMSMPQFFQGQITPVTPGFQRYEPVSPPTSFGAPTRLTTSSSVYSRIILVKETDGLAGFTTTDLTLAVKNQELSYHSEYWLIGIDRATADAIGATRPAGYDQISPSNQLVFGTPENISTVPSTYYLVVTPKIDAPTTQPLWISLTGLSVQSPATAPAANIAGWTGPLSLVDSVDTLTLTADRFPYTILTLNLPPNFYPPGYSFTNPISDRVLWQQDGILAQQGYIRQGTSQRLLQVTLATNDQVVLNSLRVTFTGDVASLKVSLRFELGVTNTLVSVEPTPPYAGVFSGLNATCVATSTAYVGVFVTLDATPGQTVGIALDPAMTVLSPDTRFIGTPWHPSVLLTVITTDADFVQLTVESVAPAGIPPSGSATLLKLTLQVPNLGGNGQAYLTALVCSLRGRATLMVSGVSKVKWLKLYQDTNNNGALDKNEPVVSTTTSFQTPEPGFGVLTGELALGTNDQLITVTPKGYSIAISLNGADDQDDLEVKVTALRVADPDKTFLPLPSVKAVTAVDGPDPLTVKVAAIAPLVTLTQGQGAAILGLTMTAGAGDSGVVVIGLRVSLLGNLPLTFLTGMSVTWINPADPSNPISASGFGFNREATLSGYRAINHIPSASLLRLTCGVLTPVGTTIGLTIPGASAIKISEPDYVAQFSYTVETSSTVTVADLADGVYVWGQGLANLAISTTGYLRQEDTGRFLRTSNLFTNRDYAEMKTLRFSLTGNLLTDAIASVKLYSVGEATTPTLLGSVGPPFANREGTLTGLSVTLGSSSSYYELAIELSPTASPDATLGLAMTSPPWFTVSGVDTLNANAKTPSISTTGTSSLIEVLARDGDVASVTSVPVEAPSLLMPDALAQPFLGFSLVTDRNTARLTKLSLSLSGNTAVQTVTAVLYKDLHPFGAWQAGDFSLASCTFNAERWGTLLGFTETLTTAGRAYFVVLKASPAAVGGTTLGVVLPDRSQVTVANPDRVALFAATLASPSALIVANPRVTLEVGVVTSANVITQSAYLDVLVITLKASEGASQWKGLTLSLTGDLPVTHITLNVAGSTIFNTQVDAAARTVTLSLFHALPMNTSIGFTLQLRPLPTALPGQTIGLQLTGVGALSVLAPHLLQAGPNTSYPLTTPLLTITKGAGVIQGIWYIPGITGEQRMIRPGESRAVASVRLNRVTGGGIPLTLSALKVSLVALPAGASLTPYDGFLYRDLDNYYVWDPGDFSMASTTFDAGGQGTFGNLGATLDVDGSSRFLVVLRPRVGANPSDTVGLNVATGAMNLISLASPDVESAHILFSGYSLPTFTLQAADADFVTAVANYLTPVLAGGNEAAWFSLTLKSDGFHPSGTATLQPLELSLLGTVDPVFIRLTLYQGATPLASLTFNTDRKGTLSVLNQAIMIPPEGVSLHVTGRVIGTTPMNATAGLGFLTNPLVASPDKISSFTNNLGSGLVSAYFPPPSLLVTLAGGSTGAIPLQGGWIDPNTGSTYSVDLLNLNLKAAGGTFSLTRLQLSLLGNVQPAHGTWKIIRANNLQVVGTGVVEDFGSRLLSFNNISGPDNQFSNFLTPFTVRWFPTSTVPIGATVGLTLVGSDAVGLSGGALLTIPVAVGTTLTAVIDNGDTVVLRDDQVVNLAPPFLIQGGEAAFFRISPAVLTGDAATWTGLKVSLGAISTALPADVAAVKLYRDNGDGTWGAGDTSLGSAAFVLEEGMTLLEMHSHFYDDFGNLLPEVLNHQHQFFWTTQWASLSGFAESLTASMPSPNYFLTVSLASAAVVDRTVVLQVDSINLVLAGADIPGGQGGVKSSSLAIIKPPNVVLVHGRADNLAPRRADRSTLQSLVRLTFTTASGAATLTALSFRAGGSVDLDAAMFSLWKDGAQIGSPFTGRASFSVTRQGAFTGLTQPLTTAPAVYLLKVSLTSSAIYGDTVSVSLHNTLFGFALPATTAFLPFAAGSTSLLIHAPVQLTMIGSAVTVPLAVPQATEAAFLYVTLFTNDDTAVLNTLRLSLLGTAGPGDMSVAAFWNPQFIPSPYGPPPSYPGTWVNSSLTAAVGADRWVTLALTQAVTQTPTVLLLRAFVFTTATVGATFGFTLPDAAAVSVEAPDLPILSGSSWSTGLAFTVMDNPDWLIVKGNSSAPPSMGAGTERAFLQISLKSDVDQVVLRALTMSLSTTLSTALVTARLYRNDQAGVGWDPSNDLLATSGFDGNGNGTFTNLAVTIAASTRWFLALSLSPSAASNASLQVIMGASAVSLAPPDLTGGDAINSGIAVVEPPDLVTIASQTMISPLVMASGANKPVLRLSLTLAGGGGTAVWKELRLSLTGTMATGDLVFKLYRDGPDNNGVWTESDPNDVKIRTVQADTNRIVRFGGLTETLSNTSARTYFVVVSHNGSAMRQTFGLTAQARDALFLAPDSPADGAFGLPLVLVKQEATLQAKIEMTAPTTVNQGTSSQRLFWLTLGTDADQIVLTALPLASTPSANTLRLSLYRNSVSLGSALVTGNGWVTLSGFALTLTPTSAVYELLAAVPTTMPLGLVAVTLSTSWWDVPAPDHLGLPVSAVAAFTVLDTPDRLTLMSVDAGPAGHRQNAERVYLALTLSVDQDSAVVTTLRVQTVGNLPQAFRGSVRWYVDDSNGEWNPSADRLAAEAFFQNGTAELLPGVGLTVTGSLTTFLTARIALTATAGDFVGLSLAADPLTVGGLDVVAAFAATASSLKLVTTAVALTLYTTSADPERSAPQGGAAPLLALTFSNQTPGDPSDITGLTLALSAVEGLALTALWVEVNGLTLVNSIIVNPQSSIVNGTVVMTFSPAMTVLGSAVCRIVASLHPLARLLPVRVTLIGLTVSYPDVVAPFGLTQVGGTAVVDGADTLQLAASSSVNGGLLRVGNPPVTVLAMTASIVSLPKDSGTLTALVVSLLGAPPANYSGSPYADGWTVFLYNSGTLLDARPFVARMATLSLSAPLSGDATVGMMLALSLNQTYDSAYGGTVGLSLVRLFVAGVDFPELSGALATSLRSVYGRAIQVMADASGVPGTPLTLGADQLLWPLRLTTDRDQARLLGLTLTDFTEDRFWKDEHWLRLRVEGSNGTTMTNGQAVFSGLNVTVTTTGVTLWLAGTISPLAPFNATLALGVNLRYAEDAVGVPLLVECPGRTLLDAPTSVSLSASDFTTAIAITGEAFLALRVALQSTGDGVGVRRLGVRINALNIATLAPHLTVQLKEGNRLLSQGEPKDLSATSRNFDLGMTEAVYKEPRVFDVYLIPDAGTPPEPFNLSITSGDLSFQGSQDTALPFTLTTSPSVRVVSTWGEATLRLTEAASLVSPGATVTLGATVPLARLVLQTFDPDRPTSVARLVALRLRQTGTGLDTDVAVSVYASAPTLLTFDAAQAVKLGEGAFKDRSVVVPLAGKPFFTNLPRALWLVADVSSSAMTGATWGLEVGAFSFVTQGMVGVRADHLPFRTPFVTIVSPLPATLTAMMTSPPAATLAQGTQSVVMGTLTVQATSARGSVVTALIMGSDSNYVTYPQGIERVYVMSADNITLSSLTSDEWRMTNGARMTLSVRRPVGSSPVAYRLLADVSARAPVGTTLSVSIPSDGLLGPTLDVRTFNGGAAWTSPAFVVKDAADTLSLGGVARPLPWEAGEWTPIFLLTLAVNQDEASLIRITISTFGNLVTGELGNLDTIDFRLKIGGINFPVTKLINSQIVVLSLVNFPVTRFPSYQMATLELSLSPTVSLTGTLGLSLLGVGVAPDPVTGLVVDTVTLAPLGTSLLGLRNPAQPFPPSLTIKTRFLREGAGLQADWSALVKQGTITGYRCLVVALTGVSPDFTALAASLITDPVTVPSAWRVIQPWIVSPTPTLNHAGLALAHGLTLYIAVQAQSSTGVWSEVTFSDALVVDGRKPIFSTKPPQAVKGKRQLVLSWDAPTTGPSGVGAYVVERRKALKPKWEIVSSSAQAPRLNPSLNRLEEWGLWYPYSYGHLLIGESGNLGIGNAPALHQLPNYQITKLPNLYFPTMCGTSLLFSSQMLSISSASGSRLQLRVTFQGFV